MSKVLIEESYLTNIGIAIRTKNNGNTQYKPSEMAAAISAIDTSGITPTGSITITQNGTVDVTQYASAAVAVPNSYAAGDEGKIVSNGTLVAQTARSSQITENGTYDTTENNSVTINISSSSNFITDYMAWEQGGWNRNNNKTYYYNLTTSSNRIRTAALVPCAKHYEGEKFKISINNGYEFTINAYWSDGLCGPSNYYSDQWLTTYEFTISSTYISIAVRKSNNDSILPDEITNTGLKIEFVEAA